MTGLRSLVRVAELLAHVAGSDHAATVVAADLTRGRLPAELTRMDDVGLAARAALVDTGILDDNGTVDPARAAELVVVCDVLAARSSPPPPPVVEPRLVLTAPRDVADVADGERLGTLVHDVIRRATTELHIGGAFWNDAGFDSLDTVLVPAVAQRHVPTTIYVNPPDEPHRTALARRLASQGPAEARWFTGGRPRMLHAKFAIRDRTHGYLGTANLTSWGMNEHIEAGVELTAAQCARFVQFLEDLDEHGQFSTTVPTPHP